MLLWRPGAELRLLTREERTHERVLKIVAVFEILRPVIVALAEDARVDQIENHRADIRAIRHAPLFQNGRRHRPELIERVLTKSLKQLGAADVPARLKMLLTSEALHRFIEHAAQKKVRVAIESRIAHDNFLNGFFKSDFLHYLLGEALSLRS